MKRNTATAVLIALALLFLVSVPAGAWEEFPPGPRQVGEIDPEGGKGDTDPDDFPTKPRRLRSRFRPPASAFEACSFLLREQSGIEVHG